MNQGAILRLLLLFQQMDPGLVSFAVFVVLLFFTGSFILVGLAIVLSFAAGELYQKFVVGRLPVPNKAAVIITGCSSGIGHDAAIHLAAKGFTVFAGVRQALLFCIPSGVLQQVNL